MFRFGIFVGTKNIDIPFEISMRLNARTRHAFVVSVCALYHVCIQYTLPG